MYDELVKKVEVLKSLVESLGRDVEVATTGKKNIRMNIKKTCKEVKDLSWSVRDEILAIEKAELEARKEEKVAE